MKSRSTVIVLLACWLAASSSRLPAQETPPLTFRAAIDLALKNSPTTGIAAADLQRARAAYTQSRDLFLPQAMLGSGLAYSYGFPLSLEGSAPSVFNVNIQEYLFNTAQRQYVKAARMGVDETTSQNAERRNDVIMETALCYVQLDTIQASIQVLREQQDMVAKLQDIVSQRVTAGLDSQVDLTRAKLAAARIGLQMGQAQAAADQLRQRLAQLTGLPGGAIQTATESIPQLPVVSQTDDLASLAAERSPAVKMAEQAAQSKSFRAKGEKRMLYPSVDLVAQYAVLARYNNYDQFFNKFQRHNLTLGAAIRVPFFNPSQRAAAQAAEADAAKAWKEAQNVKDQVSAETLKLQRSVRGFAEARDISKLEHQLAESDIETAHARIESGNATLKDEQNARMAAQQRFAAYLDATFQLDRAQIQLLRQIGDLEGWALAQPKR
ncbi:MAG TPA: TolC family protein [Verrucomicrobiae bacterium]|jgi:outer membrane protein TolC|nr:TolC family protein [Verrucomicrobiae bacterium]